MYVFWGKPLLNILINKMMRHSIEAYLFEIRLLNDIILGVIILHLRVSCLETVLFASMFFLGITLESFKSPTIKHLISIYMCYCFPIYICCAKHIRYMFRKNITCIIPCPLWDYTIHFSKEFTYRISKLSPQNFSYELYTSNNSLET